MFVKGSCNLVGGAQVTLNIKNKAYQGTAEIVDDKEAAAESLPIFLNQVRAAARFYQVKFDDDDQPN